MLSFNLTPRSRANMLALPEMKEEKIKPLKLFDLYSPLSKNKNKIYKTEIYCYKPFSGTELILLTLILLKV